MAPSSEGEGEGTVVSLTVNKFYQNSSWRTPENTYKYTGPRSHHSFQTDNWLCGEDAEWSDPLSLHKNEREGMLGLLPQKKRRRFPHGLKMPALQSSLEGMKKVRSTFSAEDPGEFPPSCRIGFLEGMEQSPLYPKEALHSLAGRTKETPPSPLLVWKEPRKVLPTFLEGLEVSQP